MNTETDWVVPGAEVVVYCDQRASLFLARRSTISTVGKKTFGVEGERHGDRPTRFSLIGKSHSTGPYDPPTVVVPADSPEAYTALRRERQDRLRILADSAVSRWQRDRSRENRLAAIEALQAVED